MTRPNTTQHQATKIKIYKTDMSLAFGLDSIIRKSDAIPNVCITSNWGYCSFSAFEGDTEAADLAGSNDTHSDTITHANETRMARPVDHDARPR